MKLPLRHQRARVRIRARFQRIQRRLGLFRVAFDSFTDLSLADVRALTRRV